MTVAAPQESTNISTTGKRRYFIIKWEMFLSWIAIAYIHCLWYCATWGHLHRHICWHRAYFLHLECLKTLFARLICMHAQVDRVKNVFWPNVEPVSAAGRTFSASDCLEPHRHPNQTRTECLRHIVSKVLHTLQTSGFKLTWPPFLPGSKTPQRNHLGVSGGGSG